MADRIRPSDEVVQANIKKWGIPQPERGYTVIIHCTTYNHGKYIKDALEGFVMQKCSFPFCAIIIDDCSTDNNAEIIREYAEKFPDIIKPILLGENHMQRGILRDPYFEKWHQCAKYIAQCEGDDYWIDPLKLQMQYDWLEQHPDYSLCFHNAFQVITGDGNRRVKSFNELEKDQDYTAEQAIVHWQLPTASFFYRRNLAIVPDWMERIYCGDWVLGVAILLKGKGRYIDRYMSVYNQQFNSSSACSSVRKAKMGFMEEQQKKFILSCYNMPYLPDSIRAALDRKLSYLNTKLEFYDLISSKRYYKLLYKKELLKQYIIKIGYPIIKKLKTTLKDKR